MVTVIIAAAGSSKRMGRGMNKVFLPLLGRPVLLHSVMAFMDCPEVDSLVVVAASEEVAQVEALLTGLIGLKPWRVVAGGCERQQSIANALQVVPKAAQIILVHDGARPLVGATVIHDVIAAARQHQAAGAAVPVKDTIKMVDENEFITGTPERSMLWAMQTPQGFNAAILRQAYAEAERAGYLGTDDAALVEQLGVRVKIVAGSYCNIKITTPEDITMAAAFMQDIDQDKGCEANMLRFGMGYDVHRLVEGRKLILGGVEIPYMYGLQGHSDADVLLHAIKDALLGAAALGDIGRHFPDTDDRYKGVSSLLLLDRVREILAEHGYQVNNIDATIVAEKPKLASFIPDMNSNIARVLAVADNRINVKATTTEGLGFAGKQKGIAAYAVASIIPS
jgi:2-C-methyl-D-erythritol 4-phosphate cytidylyltransferase/2-C-methyl-D-erythritol 2,4-cyclodiphosphate synthase